MKIINKNVFRIMYNEEFINAGEVKEVVDQKLLKILLNQPNVEEYVDIDELKKVEEENKKLKEELAAKESKQKATKEKNK